MTRFARFARFAPPLALMALIYFLSAQPDLSSGLGTLDLIGRKIVHMLEYGLLWFLWWRALDRRRPALAAAVSLAYAASDELHQSFVEGRDGTPVDVVVDGLGIALAWAAQRARPLRASRARSRLGPPERGRPR